MMTKEQQEERIKQLRVGVREDGTVEGHFVETYLASIYAIRCPNQYGYHVNHENKFIAFTIDDGGVDQEVRLPFEVIEQFKKWIDAGPQSAAADEDDSEL